MAEKQELGAVRSHPYFQNGLLVAVGFCLVLAANIAFRLFGGEQTVPSAALRLAAIVSLVAAAGSAVHLYRGHRSRYSSTTVLASLVVLGLLFGVAANYPGIHA